MPSGNGHQSAQSRQATAAKQQPVPEWWEAVVADQVGQRSAPQRNYRPHELLSREPIEKLLALGLSSYEVVEVRVETHVSHTNLIDALGQASQKLPIVGQFANRDGNFWLLTVIVNNRSTVEKAASELKGGIIISYKVLRVVRTETRHQLELKLGRIRRLTP